MLLVLVSETTTKLEYFNSAESLERFLCKHYEEHEEVDIFLDTQLIYTVSPNEYIDISHLQKYFQ